MNYKYTQSLFLLSVALFLFSTGQAKDATPDPVTWKNSVKTLIYDENVKLRMDQTLCNLKHLIERWMPQLFQ